MHAVIFDIDGTLVQSAEVDDALYRKSVTSVLGPVRFRPSLSDYELVTDSGILMQLLDDNTLPITPDPSPAIQSEFIAELRRHIAAHGHFEEIPGARDLIKALQAFEDRSVAIATGGWRVSALLKLESAGFSTRGIPIATSDFEPDRSRIMRFALSQLGSTFESVTYYGDGVWDRDACRKLGWEFVAVGPTLNGLSAFSTIGVC